MLIVALSGEENQPDAVAAMTYRRRHIAGQYLDIVTPDISTACCENGRPVASDRQLRGAWLRTGGNTISSWESNKI
jgi:hypothetical protein